MSHRGFLMIADITGYTRFLTGSELEHAQGVLEDLFSVILERLKSPLALSNVQGDAFFAFSDDETNWAPGEIFDSIEALYFAFRDRLTGIIDNTTCSCRACANAGKLDLKIIVHHGEYVIQDVAGRTELAGADVILLHRLLKNDVTERTGIASYALLTAAAVGALGLTELDDAAQSYETDVEEFGSVEGRVIDLGARWDVHHAEHEIVADSDNLWFPPVTRVIPSDLPSVWTVFWHPEHRTRWNNFVDATDRVTGDAGRLRAGAEDHCAHGEDVSVFRYVDVRPQRQVTMDVVLPFNGRCRGTTWFAAEDGGTRITRHWMKPEAPNPVGTLMLRIIGRLKFRAKVEAQNHAELDQLAAYLEAERKAGTETDAARRVLTATEVGAGARALLEESSEAAG